MKKNKVILVEDDSDLREALTEYLNLSGCEVTAVDSGLEFFATLTLQSDFRVAIIDLGLPDVDGKRLVEHLRQNTRIRIIIITANDTPIIRIESYSSGADLYLSKPVEPEELLSALNSLSRRDEEFDERAEGMWNFQRKRWVLQSPDGKFVSLTSRQFHLIDMLTSVQGVLLRREEICKQLYRRHDQSTEAALNTEVSRLRKKLLEVGITEDPIKTEHGAGYYFSASVRVC